jgi:glycerophosphoryl diester phosphodiesterase
MTWLGEEGLLPRLRWLARGLRGAPRGGEHTPCIVAHRGAAKHAAENTRAAFARAIALGADGIEADVCATSDRVFILCTTRIPTTPSHASGRRAAKASSTRPSCRRKGRRSAARLRNRLSPSSEDTTPTGSPARRRRERPPLGEGSLPRHLAVRTVSPQKEVFLALREGLRGMSGSDVAAIADFELPEARRCAREIAARRVGLGLGRRLWPGYRAESADLVAARDSGEIDEVFLWTINGRARLEQAVRLSPDALLTDEPGILREVAESAL